MNAKLQKLIAREKFIGLQYRYSLWKNLFFYIWPTEFIIRVEYQ